MVLILCVMFGGKDTDDNVLGGKFKKNHTAKPRLAKPVHISLVIRLPLNTAFMWEISINKK